MKKKFLILLFSSKKMQGSIISTFLGTLFSRQRAVASFLQCVIALGIMFSSQNLQAWWMWTPGDTVDNSSQSIFSSGYKPPQPIPFSHKLHAGDRQIPCQYCHSSARRSPVSGIPPSNTCMGCHKIVAIDKDPIKYLTKMYEQKKAIPWVKVHDLPDHVRFSHQPHIIAGLECQTCHGKIEEMEVVEQWAPMQMGWCIECHNDNNAKVDCLTCHY